MLVKKHKFFIHSFISFIHLQIETPTETQTGDQLNYKTNIQS